MKILVITDSYPPHHAGGYELRCRDVLQGLKKKGYDVEIITTVCPPKKSNVHYDEQKIYRVLHKKSASSCICSWIFNDYMDMMHIDKTVKDFQPDMVYLWHIGDLSNAIVPYFSNKKLPIVLDDGGLGLVFVAKFLERGLYFYKNENDSRFKKRLKSLIYDLINICSFGLIKTKTTWPSNLWFYFNSEYSMKNALDNGVSVKKGKVIHSGIDLSKFPFRPRDSMGTPIKIAAPGRISREKGIKDAVLLLSKLKENNICSRLTIVGQKESKIYYTEILEEIRNRDLVEDVRVLSMVPHHELAILYQESDICFFPSYQKVGLSRIPLEAMASGSLIISYGNEGSDEIIDYQETGFTIPQGDINSAVFVIREMISKPTLYRCIIQNARQAVEKNHSIEAYIDKIEAFLATTQP